MVKKSMGALWVCAALLLAVALMSGYRGAANVAKAQDPIPNVVPETCVVCHAKAGTNHQVSYNELYQDGVVRVTDVAYKFSSSPDTTTVTFKMTKDGAPFDGRQADALSIYFVPYKNGKFQFDPPADRLSLKGRLSYSGGVTTSTLAELAPGASGYVDYKDVSAVKGIIVVYGYDQSAGSIPNSRVTQSKYPFAALLQTGGGVDYVSAANNTGCVKCHTDPYLKHGNIYAQVNKDPKTDFQTCKSCHLDNGKGGHFEWQLLVDNPAAAAEYLGQPEADRKLTPEQQAQYAYQTSVMNDVHMSHSMEFPYPQSMSNCVTCHEGKLNKVLSDANFNITTCKSCHAVTGAAALAKVGETPAYDTTKLALKTIIPQAIHGSMDLNKTDCTTCHGTGKMAKPFNQIHTGYDSVIYTADGLRYSKAIGVTIDSASFDGNVLDFMFTAHEFEDIKGLDVASIKPTVLVGLYGRDTKDYIIGPHERLTDDNGDGKIDNQDQRALEAQVGAKHPRITTVNVHGGAWHVTADLSAWGDLIANGTVKRVEIGIMPALKDANGVTLALNAPSRTFDLRSNKFNDRFYSPIVKVTDGCNNCHDALATTFHSPDRGGNITVCRLCHTTKNGGGHLEMQSRSMDSYAHAIHSFQAFDIGNINFADPVQAMEYEHHIESPYPTHGITNCESCHVAGTYNVPDQTRSMPGVLSASASLKGKERSIGSVPSYVTGPASRACGSCHRAQSINEDAAGELIPLNQHIRQGGYLVDGGANTSIVSSVINQVIALFR